MDANLKNRLSDLLGGPVSAISPVSGGDISQAFVIRVKDRRVFCKLSFGPEAHPMFLAEKQGLEAVANTKTVRTPAVLFCEPLTPGACLVMEYIESRPATGSDLERLGHELAALHKSPCHVFGWPQDNFIGSLPQSNQTTESWPSFYADERLKPQLDLALRKRLLALHEVPVHEELTKVLESLLRGAVPSLLHGDLWGGNYLIAHDGTPFLIDPSVYWGHSEVDLAMSRLFGGFGPLFYEAYDEILPEAEGREAREGLYRLYYLLVHLNLFGKSYYPGVKNLLAHYFRS